MSDKELERLVENEKEWRKALWKKVDKLETKFDTHKTDTSDKFGVLDKDFNKFKLKVIGLFVVLTGAGEGITAIISHFTK